MLDVCVCMPAGVCWLIRQAQVTTHCVLVYCETGSRDGALEMAAGWHAADGRA